METTQKQQERRTLYTLSSKRDRGQKWAKVKIYTASGSELKFVTETRYQYGANVGHSGEVQKAYDNAMSTSAATEQRWEVREIEDLR